MTTRARSQTNCNADPPSEKRRRQSSRISSPPQENGHDVPEIVAAIVALYAHEPGYLFRCLTISRLFFAQSCRLLWRDCGHSYEQNHFAGPFVQDLAAIAKRRPLAAQEYASHVQNLGLVNELAVRRWRTRRQRLTGLQADVFRCTVNGMRYFPLITKLRFPSLKEVWISASFSACEEVDVEEQRQAERLFEGELDNFCMNDASLVQPFGQKNLTAFHCRLEHTLRDDFFDLLGASCPNLQQVDLNWCCVQASKASFQTALQAMAATLNCLKIRLDFSDTPNEPAWTPSTLDLLLEMPRLEELWIPDIPIEWHSSLYQAHVERQRRTSHGSSDDGTQQVSPPFISQLETLTTGTSENIVGLLALIAPKVQNLTINLESLRYNTFRMLRQVARFTELRELEVVFADYEEAAPAWNYEESRRGSLVPDALLDRYVFSRSSSRRGSTAVSNSNSRRGSTESTSSSGGVGSEANGKSLLLGPDLLRLVQSCPHLHTLKVLGAKQTRDLDDAMLARVAAHLPSIRCLELVCVGPQPRVSWASVAALGRACRRLQSLVLSCELVWADVLRGSENATAGSMGDDSAYLGLFPELASMVLVQHRETHGLVGYYLTPLDALRLADVPEDREVHMRLAVARTFLMMGDKLRNFELRNGRGIDLAFDALVRTSCALRGVFPRFEPQSSP